MDWLPLRAQCSLAAWKRRPFARGSDLGPGKHDHFDRYALVIGRETHGSPHAEGLFRGAWHAIMRYDVFPPKRLTRVVGREPLQVGDTVGARYHLVPGLDVFFASRVIDVFDALEDHQRAYRAGFTYRTLAGHPELGEETFSAVKDVVSGDVSVELRSWSRPGSWIARFGWRAVRRLQLQACNEALQHLQRAAHERVV